MRVLDLGGGTGLSARSFLGLCPWAELTVVEPDTQMLKLARETLAAYPATRFVEQSAEAFPFSSEFDLILVGSAWHWMDRQILLKKFEATHVGAVFIFEYQFPKAKSVHALNEWVRREFNLKWRTLEQVPRGTLAELTQGLRESFQFHEVSRTFFINESAFELDSFFGMILSQSRFLAYESSLPEDERIIYRQKLRAELEGFWSQRDELIFQVSYESFLFRTRRL